MLLLRQHPAESHAAQFSITAPLSSAAVDVRALLVARGGAGDASHGQTIIIAAVEGSVGMGLLSLGSCSGRLLLLLVGLLGGRLGRETAGRHQSFFTKVFIFKL